MDMGSSYGYVGYGIGAAGVLAAVAQMAWSRFFSREGRANDALIQQLVERIGSQETRLQQLERDLDTERNLRRAAEDKVHMMEVYVVALKLELGKHGIKVPDLTTLATIARLPQESTAG